MGVFGLWEALEPATTYCTLNEFAIKEGFHPPANRSGPPRMLRVGFNASAWLSSACRSLPQHRHSTKKSPELRTIFFRLATISRMLVQAHFVFDGPSRPKVKRGGIAKTAPHFPMQHFRELIAAFGFSWHEAPGGAGADLAGLNSRGLIDVVVTEDSDVLAFGAHTVMRSEHYDDMKLYTMDALEHSAGVTKGALLLVTLMSGADYDDGIRGCDVDIALQLAHYGFGDELLHAVETLTAVQYKE
ncbi:hypothetical protein ID866_11456, partial [Astraeus odoratus]